MTISENKACIFCINSNPDREKDGKFRCERFSEWRDPIATVECDEFFDKGEHNFWEEFKKYKNELKFS